MNIILLGPPGAGKGTQSQRIQAKYNFFQIATGDLLRNAVREETTLGLQAAKFMDEGKLVPDELIIDLIQDVISKLSDKDGFIFDGFPRTEPQAIALDQLMSNLNQSIDAVIQMDVTKEALVERITGRFSCKSCGASYHDKFNLPKTEGQCDYCGGHDFIRRSDDTPEAVATRFDIYDAQIQKICPYYEEAGKLHKVDGLAEMDVVTESIEEIIGDRRLTYGIIGI